eukprot:CAMPEP_0185278476 /NCGR_PEP_ID=MMETSP1359-20130426/61150_1 /TAXON_ID=552665 /ORGANISM="Bigelowiella longifila, Strain CCMP242" /LENGTH=54 /DNA_ID=CAMNT_0027873003 /DNA_START=362 /DNA_END=526 /DNA_ORIENTATION=+
MMFSKRMCWNFFDGMNVGCAPNSKFNFSLCFSGHQTMASPSGVIRTYVASGPLL